MAVLALVALTGCASPDGGEASSTSTAPSSAPMPVETTTPVPTSTPGATANPATTARGAPTTQLPPTVPVATTTPPVATTAVPQTLQVRGDEECSADTSRALDLLRVRAPAHLLVVMANIVIVQCAGDGSGMYAYETPPRFVVGDETRNSSDTWYAGSIVHDACHGRLYSDYASAHPGEHVPDETWTGRGAEATCIAAQVDALMAIGGSQNEIDHLSNVLDTEYYEVPLEDRWW